MNHRPKPEAPAHVIHLRKAFLERPINLPREEELGGHRIVGHQKPKPDRALTKEEIDQAHDRCEASNTTLSLTRSNMYDAEERKVQIERMRKTTERFYWEATTINVHAFIEFTGLMNKFIDVCSRAHEADLDYNVCTTHTGKALPGIQPHDVRYMAEKLECVFGPTLNDPGLRQAFLEALFPDVTITVKPK
jgi:hypothetical protein